MASQMIETSPYVIFAKSMLSDDNKMTSPPHQNTERQHP